MVQLWTDAEGRASRSCGGDRGTSFCLEPLEGGDGEGTEVSRTDLGYPLNLAI